MHADLGPLVEQFPEMPRPGTPELRRWFTLYSAARDLCQGVLTTALLAGRIDTWEATVLEKTVRQAPFNPWPDVVRAVERVRELAKLERADQDLRILVRSH
jgi:hypothetical protein